MQYFIVFMEGIVTFISPCLLPMLPVYISYFAGGEEQPASKKVLRNALGFVLGFTIVFVSLGAFAGTIGQLLTNHMKIFNIIAGLIIILFGLNFVGIFSPAFLNKSYGKKTAVHRPGFFSSIVFGLIFSIGWTPCVGAFLGSALLLAGQQGSTTAGMIMLLLYCIGLGIPFIISAVLIEKLKTTFQAIKRHYTLINRIAGVFLILIGILMMTGYLGYFLSLFNT